MHCTDSVKKVTQKHGVYLERFVAKMQQLHVTQQDLLNMFLIYFKMLSSSFSVDSWMQLHK